MFVCLPPGYRSELYLERQGRSMPLATGGSGWLLPSLLRQAEATGRQALHIRVVWGPTLDIVRPDELYVLC